MTDTNRELIEIEHKIACHELNASQVFTQMKQLIVNESEIHNKALDKAIEAVESVELQYWKSSTIPAVDLGQAIEAIKAEKV